MARCPEAAIGSLLTLPLDRAMARPGPQGPDRRRRAARRRAAPAPACEDRRRRPRRHRERRRSSAMNLAEALSPDLLLLDIAMPGLDGIGVARALAAQHPSPGRDLHHRVRPVRRRRLRGRSGRLSDEAGRSGAAPARARPGPRLSRAARATSRASASSLAGSRNSGPRTCPAWCGSRRGTSTACRPSATICAFTSAAGAG